LMVNEGVGGEAILGKPGAVKPIPVKNPLEETGLYGR